MSGRLVIGCLDDYKHKEPDEDLNDKKNEDKNENSQLNNLAQDGR